MIDCCFQLSIISDVIITITCVRTINLVVTSCRMIFFLPQIQGIIEIITNRIGKCCLAMGNRRSLLKGLTVIRSNYQLYCTSNQGIRQARVTHLRAALMESCGLTLCWTSSGERMTYFYMLGSLEEKQNYKYRKTFAWSKISPTWWVSISFSLTYQTTESRSTRV